MQINYCSIDCCFCSEYSSCIYQGKNSRSLKVNEENLRTAKAIKRTSLVGMLSGYGVLAGLGLAHLVFPDFNFTIPYLKEIIFGALSISSFANIPSYFLSRSIRRIW